MVIVKVILCLILAFIAYEAYWLIRHREKVLQFARQNELIPRRVAANNMIVAVSVIGASLVALLIYAIIAV